MRQYVTEVPECRNASDGFRAPGRTAFRAGAGRQFGCGYTGYLTGVDFGWGDPRGSTEIEVYGFEVCCSLRSTPKNWLPRPPSPSEAERMEAGTVPGGGRGGGSSAGGPERIDWRKRWASRWKYGWREKTQPWTARRAIQQNNSQSQLQAIPPLAGIYRQRRTERQFRER